MSSSVSFSQPAAAFISPSLKAYLATRTPSELKAILNVIHAMCKKGSANNMPKGQHKMTKIKRVGQATSTKRPLNSWMAFRTYYSPIFVAQQQKDISGLMTSLWKADPFHAKWAILAKAYSVIRDYKATAQPELESFLAICCPHIGIISPQDYLQMLGWKFESVDGVKSLTRNFAPEASDFDEQLKSATLSIEDIISFCHEVGHVDTNNIEALGGRSSLIMAASIPPSARKSSANSQSEKFDISAPAASNISFSTTTTPAFSYPTAANTNGSGLGAFQLHANNSNIAAASAPTIINMESALTFNGYHGASNANSAGLGISQLNAASDSNTATYPFASPGGSASNMDVTWPSVPAGPFNGSSQPFSSYGQSAFTTTSQANMYFSNDVLIGGYNETDTFEPLAGDNFNAFDIGHFTEAELNVFDEDMFVNFDFDGNAN